MPVVSVAETSESSLFAKVDIYWYQSVKRTLLHCGTHVGMCFSFGTAFGNRKSAIPGAIK